MRPWYQRYPSVIVAILFVLAGAAWYGYRAYDDQRIAKMPLPPLSTSHITFLGLSPKTGYRILIINGQPYLVKRGENDQFANPDPGSEVNTDQKRVPVDQLLKAIDGDGKAFGTLLYALEGPNLQDSKVYKKVPVSFPVTYSVLGTPRTITATVEAKLEENSPFLKDNKQQQVWKKNFPHTLNINEIINLVENSEVVLTEKHITHVSVEKSTAPPPAPPDLYELHFDLTDAGRIRLLQETSKHLGEQLIIAANGVPVAAPLIVQQLNVNRVDIPNVTSEQLVTYLKDTCKEINLKVE